MASTGVAPIPALISSTGASRPVEDERAARRRDVELVADGEPGVQVAAGGAVGFALDGDPVVAGVGRPGEGVVAEQRPLLRRRAGRARVRYWPGRGGRQRRAVRVLEADRDHRVALAVDRGDGQPAEAGPGRRRARRPPGRRCRRRARRRAARGTTPASRG